MTILLALVAATLAALLFIATAAYRDLAAELRKADALAIEQARRANTIRAELAEEIGLRRKLAKCVVEQQKAIPADVTPIHDGVVLDLFREQLGRPSETWMGWDA